MGIKSPQYQQFHEITNIPVLQRVQKESTHVTQVLKSYYNSTWWLGQLVIGKLARPKYSTILPMPKDKPHTGDNRHMEPRLNIIPWSLGPNIRQPNRFLKCGEPVTLTRTNPILSLP